MRQYRENKLTESQRIKRNTDREVLAYSKANPHLRAAARRARRRDIYRARQVIEAGFPLSSKKHGLMTVEDALSILRGDGKRQRDLLGPRKPSKQKGVPKKRSYNTQAKLNDKLRQMVLEQGLTPSSAPLLSEDPNKLKHLSMAEASKPKSLLDAMDDKPAKKKKEKEPEFRLPSALASESSYVPKTEAELIRERLTMSLISQGKMPAPSPSVAPANTSPDEAMFGGKTFTFT
jgi:hypothetical protein